MAAVLGKPLRMKLVTTLAHTTASRMDKEQLVESWIMATVCSKANINSTLSIAKMKYVIQLRL
jgi:hypothetical protein